MAIFADNCNRGAGGPPLGTSYTPWNGMTGCRSTGTAYIAPVTADGGEYRDDNTFGENQYIQGTLVDVDDLTSNGSGTHLCVRGESGAHTFYAVRFNEIEGLELYEVVAGAYTSRDVDSGPTPINTDLGYVEATGSGTATVLGKLNGVEYVSYVDATPLTGPRVGIKLLAGNTFCGIDDLEGGDLGDPPLPIAVAAAEFYLAISHLIAGNLI